jgi:hypothetical protein
MVPRITQKPPQNRLLASLPNADFERLRPHLEPVRLEYKRSLYEVNKPIEFVYFLDTGVSSLVNTMANGDASEVGTIGNEGVVGRPQTFWISRPDGVLDSHSHSYRTSPLGLSRQTRMLVSEPCP